MPKKQQWFLHHEYEKKLSDPNKSRQGFTYIMHPEANHLASIYMLYVNIRL